MADLVELRRLYAFYEGLIFNGPSGRLVDMSKRDKAIQKLRDLDQQIKVAEIQSLRAEVAEKDAEIAALKLEKGDDGDMTLNGGLR